jgi:hypothetical protein
MKKTYQNTGKPLKNTSHKHHLSYLHSRELLYNFYGSSKVRVKKRIQKTELHFISQINNGLDASTMQEGLGGSLLKDQNKAASGATSNREQF